MDREMCHGKHSRKSDNITKTPADRPTAERTDGVRISAILFARDNGGGCSLARPIMGYETMLCSLPNSLRAVMLPHPQRLWLCMPTLKFRENNLKINVESPASVNSHTHCPSSLRQLQKGEKKAAAKRKKENRKENALE